MPDADFSATDELAQKLATLSENRTLEFKRTGNVRTALATVVAFANTEGGHLVLGVEDENKAKGRERLYGIGENPEAIDELRRKLRTGITPPMDGSEGPSAQFLRLPCILRDREKGELMVVTVPKSGTVHNVVDGGTYVRLEKGNRHLSAEEITSLSLRRGSVDFVSQPVDVDLDLLDTTTWRQYVAARRLTRPMHEALQHLGLAKFDAARELMPTRAAVLLFAENPSDLLDSKSSIRVFHYKGTRIEHQVNTNLARPPRTVGGPLITQINEALAATLDALASGVQIGPLGFEIAQKYPVRVVREAITNAIIHRDYSVSTDIHIRVFDDRVEVSSPGGLPGIVTVGNLEGIGSHPRNRALVDHLREFPSPPNLDAGEGVRMMFHTMREASLYPPQYRIDRDETGTEESVRVTLINEARPSIWEQVDHHLKSRGTIGNAELRALLRTDDPVRASRLLKTWVAQGLLAVTDPTSPRQHRRYSLPTSSDAASLFARLREKAPDA